MPTREGVLNLAGNFLPNIFNLDGLVSLTELPRGRIEHCRAVVPADSCRETCYGVPCRENVSNVARNIRRNSISTTAGVEQASVTEANMSLSLMGSCFRAALRVAGHQVPQLQRLFASHNNIVLHEVRPLQTYHSTTFRQLLHIEYGPETSIATTRLRSSEPVIRQWSIHLWDLRPTPRSLNVPGFTILICSHQPSRAYLGRKSNF